MRLLSCLALPCAVLAAVLSAPALASAHAGRFGWGDRGYVYLNNNTAGANTISGFSRSGDGALTPLPGSPFQAGGAGLGAGLASQGAIENADGRYVLAADAGSNQISVLRIGWNGTSRPSPGARLAPTGSSRTASPSTMGSYTSPTPAPAGPITPDSSSPLADSCARSGGRR
jgi:hypothetical protein